MTDSTNTKAPSKAHLVPGSMWTISPNKGRRDYSWVGDVWEIIRTAGPTAWLRRRGPGRRSYGNVVDVQIAEHDWFSAEGVLEDLDQHMREAEAEVNSYAMLAARTGKGEQG